MIFALHLTPQLIKFARMRVLQLIHFKDRVISASRRSYRNRKFDPFQHFGSMNTHHNTSFNMVANEVHSSIGLEYVFSSRSIIPNLPQNVFRPEKLNNMIMIHIH
jgi:hypothetical protein